MRPERRQRDAGLSVKDGGTGAGGEKGGAKQTRRLWAVLRGGAFDRRRWMVEPPGMAWSPTLPVDVGP